MNVLNDWLTEELETLIDLQFDGCAKAALNEDLQGLVWGILTDTEDGELTPREAMEYIERVDAVGRPMLASDAMEQALFIECVTDAVQKVRALA